MSLISNEHYTETRKHRNELREWNGLLMIWRHYKKWSFHLFRIPKYEHEFINRARSYDVWRVLTRSQRVLTLSAGFVVGSHIYAKSTELHTAGASCDNNEIWTLINFCADPCVNCHNIQVSPQLTRWYAIFDVFLCCYFLRTTTVSRRQ